MLIRRTDEMEDYQNYHEDDQVDYHDYYQNYHDCAAPEYRQDYHDCCAVVKDIQGVAIFQQNFDNI